MTSSIGVSDARPGAVLVNGEYRGHGHCAGTVYSQILNLPARQLMPYVCVGLIVWGFIISSCLMPAIFSPAPRAISSRSGCPICCMCCRFVFSKTIIFAHDFPPIYIALILYFRIWPERSRCTNSGFLLLVTNRRARQPDHRNGLLQGSENIPRIIASLAQIVFLITPIIWTPEALGSSLYLHMETRSFT